MRVLLLEICVTTITLTPGAEWHQTCINIGNSYQKVLVTPLHFNYIELILGEHCFPLTSRYDDEFVTVPVVE